MTAVVRRSATRAALSAAAGNEDALDTVFAALADPIRRAIIARLAEGPCSAGDLGAPFAVSAPAISKHLAVLERCGLIVRWKTGRVHYCRLVADPLADAASWIERHRAFWERRLDALGDYLDREDIACDRPQTGDRRE